MDTPHYSLFLAITLATLFVVVILLYLVFRIIQKQQQLMRLQRQMIKVEIATLEKERTRIAGDLHDDIGPLLAAIKYRMAVVAPGTERDKNELDLCFGHLDDAIVRLRQVTHNLLPATLERRGLVEAIQDLIAITNQLHALQIEFAFELSVPLSKEIEIQLYRMVQEGLANCIQHAAATRFRIKLSADRRLLTLLLMDNGVGISKKAPAETHRGRGIAGFRNRATLLGGQFTLDSEPGKGTILTFVIPNR
jgi:two-component system, NarL family, sensor kinase